MISQKSKSMKSIARAAENSTVHEAVEDSRCKSINVATAVDEPTSGPQISGNGSSEKVLEDDSANLANNKAHKPMDHHPSDGPKHLGSKPENGPTNRYEAREAQHEERNEN